MQKELVDAIAAKNVLKRIDRYLDDALINGSEAGEMAECKKFIADLTLQIESAVEELKKQSIAPAAESVEGAKE